MRKVAVVTSPWSVSLQKVSRSIAQVFDEKKDELNIDGTKLFLSQQVSPTEYQDVDLAIVVMTFDPLFVKAYAFIVYYLQQYGKKAIFYTTTEGKLLPTDGIDWIKREIVPYANSEYTKEKLIKYGMRVAGVVYHGIDFQRFQSYPDARPLIREQLGLSENDFVAGYIAGCYSRKGHDRYAEVIRQVYKKDPSIKFVVLTTDKCAKHYDGVPNTVVVSDFGKLDDEEVEQMYQAFDIYVHASLSEGFGLPVLEALASGLPVVHTDYKPLSEITTKETSFRAPTRFISYIQETGAIKYELHYYKIDEFVDAILKAKEAVLSKKEYYREKALERAKEFDIHKVYNAFVQLLNRGETKHE